MKDFKNSIDKTALSAEQRELLADLLAEEGIELQKTQTISPRENPDELPLSFAQQRLWFLDQLTPGTSAYNIPAAVSIQGRLNATALEQSLKEIVQRHEALRTRFLSVDEQPVQVIAEVTKLTLSVIDLREFPESDRQTQTLQLAAEEAQQPFNLTQGPLLRAKLLRLTEEEYVLLLTMHHIVSDGWSLGVFVRELAALYEAFSTRRPSPLPKLPIQYANFALWQREWLQGEVLETQLAYWKQQLGGNVPVLELPTDRPRPKVQTFTGRKRALALPKSLSEALADLSQQEGVTPFMTLLTAFKILLYRYTGQEDIVVGSPVANRNQAEIEDLIGFFVNTLVLRTDFEGNPSFRQLLDRVREVCLGAYNHQDLPFEKLVETLQPERKLSHTPLFQVIFAFQNAPMPALEFAGLKLSPLAVDNGTAKFDLTLDLEETPKGIKGYFEYNTDLFNDDTIQRMAGHFQTLLEGIVANPEQRLSDLPVLTPTEQHQLLVEWNNTERQYAPEKCLHQLFEAQVEQKPDAVAVVFQDQQLTYRELNRRANQLGHYLQTLGVGPEVLVGLCVEDSLELVVGILGILKAGGAYVPLDMAHPQERLAFILEDAQVSVLLTQERLVENLPARVAQVVCIDTDWEAIAGSSEDNPASKVIADNLAYVIYTSGSTGKPKGVLVKHANVVRLFANAQAWFNFSKHDVWTLFHSYAFDFSVWEIWGAWLYGGRLVIVPYWMRRSPETFYQLLCSEQVTVLNQTPGAFRQLIQVEELVKTTKELSLRLVIFGGEALELQSLKPWFERHGDHSPQLVNMYGITETTVHVTYRPLTIADLNNKGSVIGSPIPDLQVYLLDRHLQLVPVGVTGEIYVGGAGLARGYLARPDLTAERFIPYPFSNTPGARLYKTGDLARYLQNGELEYLGRIDHQVKIRGFRIELGDIEAALSEHLAVGESIVTVREDEPNNKRLVAYIVPAPEYAFPVLQLLRLEKKGLLHDKLLYELPNGMAIVHLNKAETEFVYKEIWEQQAYLKHGISIDEGDCIFDVGANIGLFTLFVGQTCKNVSIYAFEPIPPVFELLRLNAEIYGLNVKLFNSGISSETTSATFTYYPKVSVMSGRFGNTVEERELVKSVLLKQQVVANETKVSSRAIDELLVERLQSEDFTCQLTTISEVIRAHGVERIDLLKIDVEKSELDVLAGIQPEDWPKIRQIVVEVHDINHRLDKIVALLKNYGYNLTVEQDTLLEATALYNIYAVRASEEESSGSLGDDAKLTWSSSSSLISDLRSFLQKKLPEYMVPSAFALLESLPLTSNGKIDRHQLPVPNNTRPEWAKPFVAPRNSVEETLAQIWADILEVKQVSIDDNFFKLGGHSLLATQLISRLQKTFQVELPLRVLFEAATIADLAVQIIDKQVEQVDSEKLLNMLVELEQLSNDEVQEILSTEN